MKESWKPRDKISSLERRSRLGCNFPRMGSCTRCSTNIRGELPGLFIVSQVELHNHAGEGIQVKISIARAAEAVRAVLEIYGRCRLVAAELPTVCAACAGAVREMVHV